MDIGGRPRRVLRNEPAPARCLRAPPGGCLARLARSGYRARQPAPAAACRAMYDAHLPPVVAVGPWPVLCPPLPPGRIVQPPTREGRMECPEHYESIAADVFRTYETSADEEVRRRSADVLGQLWLARRLRGDIRALIVERHYVPELVQIPLPDGRLELSVVARGFFMFPPVTSPCDPRCIAMAKRCRRRELAVSGRASDRQSKLLVSGPGGTPEETSIPSTSSSAKKPAPTSSGEACCGRTPLRSSDIVSTWFSIPTADWWNQDDAQRSRRGAGCDPVATRTQCRQPTEGLRRR